MAEFDAELSDAISKDGVVYTRYADDLTFSAKRVGNLKNVDRVLRRIIRTIRSPRLTLNEEKTILATKKYRRVVTGLVLSDKGDVSLGHQKKRNIRAAMHHFVSGKLTAEETAHLAGLLAYVNVVEPSFLARLTEKYGAEVLRKLKAPNFALPHALPNL